MNYNKIVIQEYVETLPEDEVFAILKKYRIFPNKEFLIPLLDILQLRKNGNINYRELLYLLNWKRPSPVLPKIKRERERERESEL
jgi:hypothetical protein